MNNNKNRLRAWLSRGRLIALIAAGSLLSGCASMYVDTALKDVQVSEYKAPAKLAPVQLSFEFQTKGAPNARATDFLKAQVAEQVNASGLFSAIDGVGGGQLSVVLNNVPLTDNAAAQGFVTGLTFGLAGSAVTDGYICTITYLPASQNDAISKTTRHAIHTTLGNASPPAGVTKAKNGEDAVRTMTRQIVGNALKDLSQDPKFN